MSTNIFPSNRVAREILEKFSLQQCVVLAFSDTRGYEIVSAGDNDIDAQTAAEVAKGLSEGLTQTGLPVNVVV